MQAISAGAVAGIVLILATVVLELRKTPAQEAKMIEHENDVMSDVTDDPNEPAKWVP
jgi:hypothetical protein